MITHMPINLSKSSNGEKVEVSVRGFISKTAGFVQSTLLSQQTCVNTRSRYKYIPFKFGFSG